MPAGKSRISKQNQERLLIILEMREDERTMDYIGRKLGISRQRVHTILKAHHKRNNQSKENGGHE